MSGPVFFEQVWPAGPGATAAELLRELRADARAVADRPFVYLNMIASVDGRAAVDGRTRALGEAGDLELLLELRATADAVLIGTGTVAAEGYARLVGSEARRARRVEAGLAEDPPAVLLTRGLNVPWDAGLFKDPAQPVLVYAGLPGTPPPVPAPVEIVHLEDPRPAALMADLQRRGIRALLCEGGPRLNRALLADGVLDELFLTLAPLITGDDLEPTIVAGGRLADPRRLALQWVLRHGAELFLRYGVQVHERTPNSS